MFETLTDNSILLFHLSAGDDVILKTSYDVMDFGPCTDQLLFLLFALLFPFSVNFLFQLVVQQT